MVYVGGSTSVSDPAQDELKKLLDDPKAKLDEGATFTKFLHAQAGLPQPRPADVRPAAARLGGARGADRGQELQVPLRQAPTRCRYVATIGAVAESKIPIYLPKTFDTSKGLHIPTIARGGRHHLARPGDGAPDGQGGPREPGAQPRRRVLGRSSRATAKNGLPLLHDRGRGRDREHLPEQRTPTAPTSRARASRTRAAHVVSQKLWGTNPQGHEVEAVARCDEERRARRPRATRSPRRRRTSPSPGRCSWRCGAGPARRSCACCSRPAGRSWRRCIDAPGDHRVRRRGDGRR